MWNIQATKSTPLDYSSPQAFHNMSRSCDDDTDCAFIGNSEEDVDSDATPDTDRVLIGNSEEDVDSDATPDTDRVFIANSEEERAAPTSTEDVNVSTSPTDMIADFFSWITDELLERERQIEGEGGGCVTTEVVGPDAV
jgi:hypothetical protein